MPIDFSQLSPELQATAYQESTWDPNKAPQAAYDTGAFQIIPETFIERVNADKGLSKYKSVLPQWPAVVDRQHPLDDGTKKAISNALLADHGMQVDVARSLARSIVKGGVTTPERFYYAWNRGLGAEQAATDDDVVNDPNVQSFMRAYEGLKNGTLKLPKDAGNVAPITPPKPLTKDQEDSYNILNQAWQGAGAKDYLKDAHDRGIDPVAAHSGLLFQAVHALNNGANPASIEAGLGRPVSDIQADYNSYKGAQKQAFDAIPATVSGPQSMDFSDPAQNTPGKLFYGLMTGEPGAWKLIANAAGQAMGQANDDINPISRVVHQNQQERDQSNARDAALGLPPDPSLQGPDPVSKLLQGALGQDQPNQSGAQLIARQTAGGLGSMFTGGQPPEADPDIWAQKFGTGAGLYAAHDLIPLLAQVGIMHGAGSALKGAIAPEAPQGLPNGSWADYVKDTGITPQQMIGYRGEPDVAGVNVPPGMKPPAQAVDPTTHEPVYQSPTDKPQPFRTNITGLAAKQVVDPTTLEPKPDVLQPTEPTDQPPFKTKIKGSAAKQAVDPNSLEPQPDILRPTGRAKGSFVTTGPDSGQAVNPETLEYDPLYDKIYQLIQDAAGGEKAGPNTTGQDYTGHVISDDDSYEPEQQRPALKAAEPVDEPTRPPSSTPDLVQDRADANEKTLFGKQDSSGLLAADGGEPDPVATKRAYLDQLEKAGIRLPSGPPAAVTPDVDLESVNPESKAPATPGPATTLDEKGFGGERTPVEPDPSKPNPIRPNEPSESFLKTLRRFAKDETGSVNFSELPRKLRDLGSSVRKSMEGWLNGSREFQSEVGKMKEASAGAVDVANKEIEGRDAGDLRDRWLKAYNKAIDAPRRAFLAKAKELGVNETTAEAHANLLTHAAGKFGQALNNVIARSKAAGYLTSGGSWASEIATEGISPVLSGDTFDPEYHKVARQVNSWLRDYAQGKAIDVKTKNGTINIAGTIDELIRKGALESKFLGDDSKSAILRELAQRDAKAAGGLKGLNADFWARVDKTFGKGTGYYDHLLNTKRAASTLNQIINKGMSVDDAIYRTNKFYAQYDRPLGGSFNAVEKSPVVKGLINASLKFPKEMTRIAANAATDSPGSAMRLSALVAAGAYTSGGGLDLIARAQGASKQEIDSFKKHNLTNFERSLPFTFVIKTPSGLRAVSLASIISPLAEAAGIGKGLLSDPGPDAADKVKNVARDAMSQYFQHGYIASLLGKERPGDLKLGGAAKQLYDQPSRNHLGLLLQRLPIPTGIVRDLALAGKPTQYDRQGDLSKDLLKSFGVGDYGNIDDVMARTKEIQYGFKDPAKDIATTAKNPDVSDPAVRKDMIQEQIDKMYRRGQDLQK